MPEHISIIQNMIICGRYKEAKDLVNEEVY
jgi:hypothetical protein